MALSRCLPILLLLLVAMPAIAGASEDGADFYVTKCYPPPTPTADGASSFRWKLAYLLEALPSAAESTGFASLQTAGSAAADRASVRGLCFGDSASAPKPCSRCLSNAAKKIAERCGDASRRAGFWDERCFLGYADGANSSSTGGADDDFGAVRFSGDAVPSPDTVSAQRLVALAQSLATRAATGSVATADVTTPAIEGDAVAGNRAVRVLAQCAGDRAAGYCAGCLRLASVVMAKTWTVGGGARGRVAAVLGSNCYLRFEIPTPSLPLGEKIGRMIEDNLLLAVCGAVLLVCAEMVDVCARRIKARRKDRNAAAAAGRASGRRKGGLQHMITRASRWLAGALRTSVRHCRRGDMYS